MQPLELSNLLGLTTLGLISFSARGIPVSRKEMRKTVSGFAGD